MARRLTVPTQYRRGYELLASSSDELFGRILDAIEKAQAHTYPPALVRTVSKGFGDDADAVSAMLTSAMTAQALREADRSPASVVAEDMANGEGLELPESQRGTFVARLTKLLEARALGVSVRAAEMASVDEKLMISATVVPDLRVVFDEEEAGALSKPQGAFVLYTLRFDVHQGSGDDAIALTLDQDDLRNLQSALNRAEREGAALRELAGDSGVDAISVGLATDD